MRVCINAENDSKHVSSLLNGLSAMEYNPFWDYTSLSSIIITTIIIKPYIYRLYIV